MNILEKRTTILNGIFTVGNTLASLFLNVYLYTYTNSLVIMCIYTIIRISLFPLFFILGSKIVKKHYFSYTFAIGLVFITASLVYALLGSPLFEKNAYCVLFAAVLTGIGEGFYWLSSNTCNVVVSTLESRAKFMSITGAVNSIGNLLAPFLANFIVNHSVNDIKAYKTILTIIIILYILVFFVSLTINIKSNDKGFDLANSFNLKDKVWRDHSIAVILYGLRNSLTLALTNILVFNAAGSGGTYSKLQSLFAVITIVSYFLLAKALDKNHIDKTFMFGVFIAMSSTIVLVLFENVYGAIFFGVANALSCVFYENSYSYLSANIISRYKNEVTARVVARETYLSFSRCLGMGIIVLFYYLLPENLYLKVSVILLSLSSILVYKILIKYKEKD